MGWRRVLPRFVRDEFVMRWVERAEQAEDRADLYPDVPTLQHKYGRRAIECYLRAWAWKPMEYPVQMPTPEDLGSHPADEQMWPEELDELALVESKSPDPKETIPCILCGTRIPRARVSDPAGAGMYCPSCAKM